MTAYFVARLSVKDPEAMAEYSKSAGPLIAAHGGKVLFRGDASDNLVGEMNMPNIVVFAFPTKGKITEFFNSAEYQALTDMREAGAEMVLSAHDAV